MTLLCLKDCVCRNSRFKGREVIKWFTNKSCMTLVSRHNPRPPSSGPHSGREAVPLRLCSATCHVRCRAPSAHTYLSVVGGTARRPLIDNETGESFVLNHKCRNKSVGFLCFYTLLILLEVHRWSETFVSATRVDAPTWLRPVPSR